MIDSQVTQVAALLRRSTWFMTALTTVRDAGLPDAWIGGGAIRDVVWGHLYAGGCPISDIHDIDVAFFDPADLTRMNDDAATAALRIRRPDLPWQAKNQAAVHRWYPARFGGDPVTPLVSIADAAASWPETVTSIAVRLTPVGDIEICAPLGLDDLLHGVWRRNPRRVSIEISRQRVDRQNPATRWPGVRVVAPESSDPAAPCCYNAPATSSPHPPIGQSLTLGTSLENT